MSENNRRQGANSLSQSERENRQWREDDSFENRGRGNSGNYSDEYGSNSRERNSYGNFRTEYNRGNDNRNQESDWGYQSRYEEPRDYGRGNWESRQGYGRPASANEDYEFRGRGNRNWEQNSPGYPQSYGDHYGRGGYGRGNNQERGNYGQSYGNDYNSGGYGQGYGNEHNRGDRSRDPSSESNRGYAYGEGRMGQYGGSRQGMGNETNWNSGSGNYGSGQGSEGRTGNQASQWGNSQGGSHKGRGPIGYKRSDERITEDVNDKLSDDSHLDASQIEVTVKSGEVILQGTVNNRMAKRHAEDIAEAVSGVSNVENRIRVKNNSETDYSASGNSDTQNSGSTTTSNSNGNSNKSSGNKSNAS